MAKGKTTAKKKTVTKRAAPKTKKATVKKTAAKKATVSVAKKRLVAIPKKQTRLQMIQMIADESGINKRDVKQVFDVTLSVMARHMQSRGSGEFMLPGLPIKVRRIKKKATKSREGRNPFTGEVITIPAKPARQVIKVAAMKALKEMIEK